MATIQKLPLEIFSAILDRLSTKDLSAFSRASKLIRTAAQPILYREITFNWELDWTLNSRKYVPVHLLLRCIVRRPELALYIQRLDFCGRKPLNEWKNSDRRSTHMVPTHMVPTHMVPTHMVPTHMVPSGASRGVWTSDNESDFTTRDLTVMAHLIRSLNLSAFAEDLWLEGLHRGKLDVFIALLLSQTPNLRRLRLDSNFQRYTEFIGFLFKEARFAALQQIELGIDIEREIDISYHDVDLDQILPLFSLPSIQSIRMAFPAKDIVWPSFKAPESSLTFLHLHTSQLSEEMLGQLLLATPSLRSLHYHSCYDIDSEKRPKRKASEYFDCAKLGQSLAHVQKRLENLVISVGFISLQSAVALGGFTGMVGRLNTLENFEHLLSLEILIIVLLGWTADSSPRKLRDLLPLHLRHVSLTDDLHEMDQDDWGDAELLPLIKEFLEEKESGMSQLESISLRLNHAFQDWCEEARIELKTLCERACVHCNIFKKWHDPPRPGRNARRPHRRSHEATGKRGGFGEF